MYVNVNHLPPPPFRNVFMCPGVCYAMDTITFFLCVGRVVHCAQIVIIMIVVSNHLPRKTCSIWICMMIFLLWIWVTRAQPCVCVCFGWEDAGTKLFCYFFPLWTLGAVTKIVWIDEGWVSLSIRWGSVWGSVRRVFISAWSRFFFSKVESNTNFFSFSNA